ncbi:MAG: hypothetical protein ACFFD2_06840 [Promethearchaeota archaeon]
MENPNITQLLMNAFYLNEPQADLYKLFLMKGILTLGEVSLLSKKSQDECFQLIRDLLSLKLIISLPGLVDRYKALPPFQGFFAFISRFQDSFIKINSEISKTSEKLINELKTGIQNQMSEIKNIIQSKIEESKLSEKQKEIQMGELSGHNQEIKDISEKLTNDLSKMYIEYLKSFEDRINKIKLEVDKSFSEILIEIKDIKQKSNEFMEENMDKLLSPQKEEMKKLLEILLLGLKTSIDAIRTNIEDLRVKLITPISKSEEGILDFSSGLQKNTFAFLNQQNDFVNSTFIDLKDEVINFENQILELFSNKIKKLDSNLLKSLIDLSNNIDQTLNLVKDKEYDITNSFFKNILEKLSDHIKIISESLESNKSIIIQNNETLTNEIKELFDFSLNDHKTLSNDLKSKFQISIKEIKKILNELFHKLKDKTINAVIQHVDRGDKTAKELESSLTGELKQYNDDFQIGLTNLASKVSFEFQTRINNFKTNILALKDELFQNLNATQSTIQKEIMDSQNGHYKIIDSQIEIIEKEDNAINLQIKEKILKEFENLNGEIKSAKNEVSSYYLNNLKEIETDSKLINEEIMKLVTTQISVFDKEVIILNESINTTFSNFIVQFENIMDQIQRRSLEATKNHSTSIKDYIDKLEKEFISKFNEKIESSKTKLVSFQKNLTGFLERRLKYLENIKDFEGKNTNVLKRYTELLKKSLTIIISNISNLMDKQFGNFKLTSDSFKSNYSQNTTKELSSCEELFNQLNNLNNAIQVKIIDSNNKLSELQSKIVNNIDNLITDYQNLKETFSADLKEIFDSFISGSLKIPKDLKSRLMPETADKPIDYKEFINFIVNKISPKIMNAFKKYNKKYETTLFNFKDNFTNIITENEGEFQLDFSDLTNKFSSEFQDTITLLKKNKVTLRDAIFENLDSTQATIQKDVTETQNEIIKVINAQIQTIEKEEKNLGVQLKNLIEKEFESFNSEVNSAKIESIDYFSKAIGILEKDPSLVAEDVLKLKELQLNLLNKEILLQDEAIKTTNSNFNLQFKNIMTSLNKKLIETNTKHHTESKDLILALNKKVSSKIDERTATIKKKFNTFQDNLSNLWDKRLKYLDTLKNFDSNVANDLKRHEEILKESVKIVIDNVSSLINNQINKFNLSTDSLKSHYLKVINKEVNVSEEQITGLMNQLNGKIQKNLEISKNESNKLTLAITKIIESSKLQNNKINEVLRKEVIDLVDNDVLNWSKRIDDFVQNLEFITEHIKTVEITYEKSQLTIKENLIEKSNKMSLLTKEIQNKIKDLTEKNITSINSFFDSLKKGYDQSISDFVQQIKETFNLNQKSLSGSFDLILVDLKRNFASNQDGISNSAMNSSRKLENQLEIHQEQISNSMNELHNSLMTNYLTKAKTDLETSTQTTLATLEKSVAPIKEKFSSITTQNIDNFGVFLLNLKKKFQGISDRIMKDYEYKVQIVSESVDHELYSFFNDHKEIVSRDVEQLNTQMTQNIEKIQLSLEEFKTNYGKDIDLQLSNYHNLLDSTGSKLMTNFNQFQTKTIEPLNKTVENIMKNLQNIQLENQTTLDILKSILVELDKITLIDMEKTWPLISSESIMNYMEDMISRTKRSISIILPQLSKINLEYFKKLDPHILVHIFTTINPQTDNQIFTELVSYKNVRIWQKNNKFAFYCIIKDKDEMILAPFSDNEKEVVGFITEQKEYLNIFQKILGPYFYSESTELKTLQTEAKVETTS